MKLVNSRLGLEIDLLENQILNLTIESPEYFSEVLSNICKQVNGEEGEFILSEVEKELSLSTKAMIVANPLSVSCNEKRILSQLYKELAEVVCKDCAEKFAELNQYILYFVDEIINSAEYNLVSDVDCSAIGLIKYCNVHMDTCYDSLAEQFIDYLRAMKTICKIDIVFVLNIKQYFNTSELEEIYKYCFYMKIYLINLEGIKSNPIKQDKYIIIDKDLCILEILY